MAKPNAFVKISGSLLEKHEVLEWLGELGKKYYVVVCIGGGEQINKVFKERGFEIKFGPLGRVTQTLEERQLARDILEQNEAVVQDMIDRERINARVIIPVDYVANVLCHVNGDVKMLAAYNGFDRLYELTPKDNVGRKRRWLKRVVKCFESIGEGELDKIQVVGF